jgi:phosphate starvation-inducible PhoH-like protein
MVFLAGCMVQASIPSVEPRFVLPLFGARDQHLRRLREKFNVDITHRDGEIRVTGEEPAVTQVTKVLEELTAIIRQRGSLTPDVFDETIAQVTGDEPPPRSTAVETLQAGRPVRPKTPGQAAYVESIRNHDMIFAVGPAGSGKTYLAVAAAVEALKQEVIRKIVLVRPAVEAGESLGYLPGDLQAKINPYLRPLMDALNEMIGFDHLQRLIQHDVIEVIPLAYMRGRTLNDAFIILDEAQNTTIAQMKMFLTRMGHGSKIVVSGDPTQIDLPPNQRSGLIDAIARLRSINGIAVTELTRADIVRNRLVQHVVDAYERRGPRHAADSEPDK